MAQVAPDSTETRSLLEQAGADDRQAFERLFARHRPYLRKVIGARLDPKVRSRSRAERRATLWTCGPPARGRFLCGGGGPVPASGPGHPVAVVLWRCQCRSLVCLSEPNP